MTRNKFLITLFALMFMGAIFFTLPAYAADDPLENLSVDAVWLVGDTLHIEVTDKLTGINQTLQLPLDEYAGNSEYVSVQAVDRNGGKSNTIQFKNPFYVPGAEPLEVISTPSESGVPNGEKPSDSLRPFTPDGTGTVIDNVTNGDGKEFFSIQTEDGNTFYLIVDRQRSTENVYLLNAVTEDDLMSLAKEGDGKPQSSSGIPAQTQPQPTQPAPTEAPEPEPTAPPSAVGGMNSGTVIFIVIAAVAVGGIGYYFKILRPKKQALGGDEDDGFDDYDEDADYSDDDGESGEGGDDE
jgi:hypothetical protein